MGPYSWGHPATVGTLAGPLRGREPSGDECAPVETHTRGKEPHEIPYLHLTFTDLTFLVVCDIGNDPQRVGTRPKEEICEGS